MTERGRDGHSIVTTGGTDGACCAAVILIKHRDAPVFVTSQNAVNLALLSALHAEPRAQVVHVCGVGIGSPEAVWDALIKLREAGFKVIWYCGRDYLDQYRPMLEKACTAVIERAGSNTALLARQFRATHSERTDLLVELAKEYVDKQDEKKLPEGHRFWHDLIQAGSTKFFHFGDEEHFLRLLRKLAGLLPTTDSDQRDVAQFRTFGGARPLPLGTSAVMKALRRQVKRLAPLDEPVLILGPTGAGKELVARALHDGSLRRGNRFLPINCAVLGTNADLAHDRLFGHLAGAFTGAQKSARGAFEAAAGGSLFLDEVAELPVPIQTQLLRVIEELTISPLGTVEARPVNVRVIAATNRDLGREVGAGRFRADLWYRLSVLPIEVPAFKNRLEDAKAIADAQLKELGEAGYKLRLTEADWKAIRSYDWPGNVRQFANVLKRAAYGGTSLREALQTERRLAAAFRAGDETQEQAQRLFLPSRPEDVRPEEEIRKAYMLNALKLFGGNRTKAARALGVAENTLRKWVED